MSTNFNLEKEFELLVQELQNKFSVGQLQQWAMKTKFMKRKTKLRPEHFLLLCASLSESFGENTLTELCGKLISNFKVCITTEGLNQRFNSKAVEFLKQCFNTLFLGQAIHSNPIIEDRLFNRIRILDSSSFELPSEYADYKGSGGSGVKIQLEYELYQASFLNLEIQQGKDSDCSYPSAIREQIQPGDLSLRDLGYFSIDNLLEIGRRGGYYLSRVKNRVNLYYKNDDGKWIKLDPAKVAEQLKPGEMIELNEIKVGARVKDPLITRIVISRLTEEQQSKRQTQVNKKKKKGKKALSAQKNISVNIYATNIPQDKVKMEELHSLYSLRWQIEILFKTWKSLFKIHCVRKMKKERFECHLYGTLIRLLLSSTLAFQCRRMLYIKHQMETSEYKSISIAKEGLSLLKSIIIEKTSSFIELTEIVYLGIRANGRKSHKREKQTVFDILKIAYKKFKEKAA